MHTDWSVELGADDPELHIPWQSPDGRLRYFDLRRRPEMLLEIPEAAKHPELAEFFSLVNSSATLFATAKSDTWLTQELSEEEQIYGVPWKFGAYIDLLFNDAPTRASFASNEGFARRCAALLAKAPALPGGVELVLRRCFVSLDAEPTLASAAEQGYSLTCYVSGYGDDENQARLRWTVVLRLLQNALMQLSAEMVRR